MKNIILATISTLFLTVSCSRDIPEDIHDHEEANRLVVTYSEVGATVENVAEFNIGTGATAPIDLENGKIYNINVRFFHDNEDMTPEIIEEKDEHFMQYLFSNLDVSVERTSEDFVRTDGEKLGLKMKWTINSDPSNSAVNVQLIHGANSVDDAANNGAGSSQGGEPDVDVVFLIQ